MKLPLALLMTLLAVPLSSQERKKPGPLMPIQNSTDSRIEQLKPRLKMDAFGGRCDADNGNCSGAPGALTLVQVPGYRWHLRLRAAPQTATCAAARIFVPREIYMPQVGRATRAAAQPEMGLDSCEALPSTKVTYQR